MIIIIKHALNLTNATAKVQVGEQEMSIDSILVRMAQLNKRKAVLDDMRKRLPKTRVYGSAFSSSGSAPEYKYINYDPELIRQEYDRISNMIMDMQIALDRYNQTVLFDNDDLPVYLINCMRNCHVIVFRNDRLLIDSSDVSTG